MRRREEESGGGRSNTRDILCTSGPPTKRSRCHQTWEGQKISWIRGERKTHVGMAGAAAATVQGGQRAVILFREGRERQRKKAFEDSGGVGVGTNWPGSWESPPSSGPPGGLSASRVGMRREPQEVWEASPLSGRWFQVSLLVPSSLVGPHCISWGRLHRPSNAQACPSHNEAPLLFTLVETMSRS